MQAVASGVEFVPARVRYSELPDDVEVQLCAPNSGSAYASASASAAVASAVASAVSALASGSTARSPAALAAPRLSESQLMGRSVLLRSSAVLAASAALSPPSLTHEQRERRANSSAATASASASAMQRTGALSSPSDAGVSPSSLLAPHGTRASPGVRAAGLSSPPTGVRITLSPPRAGAASTLMSTQQRFASASSSLSQSRVREYEVVEQRTQSLLASPSASLAYGRSAPAGAHAVGSSRTPTRAQPGALASSAWHTSAAAAGPASALSYVRSPPSTDSTQRILASPHVNAARLHPFPESSEGANAVHRALSPARVVTPPASPETRLALRADDLSRRVDEQHHQLAAASAARRPLFEATPSIGVAGSSRSSSSRAEGGTRAALDRAAQPIETLQSHAAPASQPAVRVWAQASPQATPAAQSSASAFARPTGAGSSAAARRANEPLMRSRDGDLASALGSGLAAAPSTSAPFTAASAASTGGGVGVGAAARAASPLSFDSHVSASRRSISPLSLVTTNAIGDVYVYDLWTPRDDGSARAAKRASSVSASASATSGLRYMRPVHRVHSVHRRTITDVRWSEADAGLFTTASLDGSVVVWDAETLSLAFRFDGLEAPRALAMPRAVSQHALVAVASAERNVRLCDLRSGASVSSLSGHGAEGTLCVGWSPRDDFLLVSGGGDRTLRLWDVRKLRQVAFFDMRSSEPALHVNARDVLGDAEGRGLTPAAAATAAAAALPSAGVDGSSAPPPIAHTTPVCALVFAADGHVFYTAGASERVRSWSMDTCSCTFAAFAETVSPSRHGMHMTMALDDSALLVPHGSEVSVLCTATGVLRQRLQGHFESVWCVRAGALDDGRCWSSDSAGQVVTWRARPAHGDDASAGGRVR